MQSSDKLSDLEIIGSARSKVLREICPIIDVERSLKDLDPFSININAICHNTSKYTNEMNVLSPSFTSLSIRKSRRLFIFSNATPKIRFQFTRGSHVESLSRITFTTGRIGFFNFKVK